jgi:hypothetical protein
MKWLCSKNIRHGHRSCGAETDRKEDLMKWAALIAWVITAGGGFVLLAIWLSRGGMRQQGGAGGRIRPPLILSHFLLAAGGLVLWVIYLAVHKHALAWFAFIVLLVVAALGFTMFAIWLQRRRTVEPVAVGAAAATPAEQHFPVAIVALHGLLAATTLVLVLLTAARVG